MASADYRLCDVDENQRIYLAMGTNYYWIK